MVTAICVNILSIVNIYKNYSFIIVFVAEKGKILHRNSAYLLKSVISRWYLVFSL